MELQVEKNSLEIAFRANCNIKVAGFNAKRAIFLLHFIKLFVNIFIADIIELTE